MAKFTLRGFFPELRDFFRKMLRGFFRELRDFFPNTKPFWEIVLGSVLASLLAAVALHLQWIATNVTGTTRRIIIILAACYGLYLVRRFSRLAYGTLEIDSWNVRHHRHDEQET